MPSFPIGVITDVNHMMSQMTGYTRDALIGNTPFNRYFIDPQQVFTDYFTETGRTRSAWKTVARFLGGAI